jgi:hypothetical protein
MDLWTDGVEEERGWNLVDFDGEGIEETHFYSLVASYNYDKLHSSSHFCYPLLITPHLKRILIACVTVRALEQGRCTHERALGTGTL